MIEPAQAIGLLSGQLAKLNAIEQERLAHDDPRVYEWYRLTQRVIEETFGTSHTNVTEFVSSVSYAQTRQEHDQEFHEDIRHKKAMLAGFIEELQLFAGTTKPSFDPVRFRRELLEDVVARSGDQSRRTGQPFCDYKYLAKAGMFAHDFVLEQLEILADEGRVVLQQLPGSNECAVRPTPTGKRSLELAEQLWQQQRHHTGDTNIVNVHNYNSTIGNQIASVEQTQIHQINNSGADLKDIFELVDALMERVNASAIAAGKKRDAELEAAQLKTEIQKSAPNANRVKDILSWFGTLNGVVQFGEHLPSLIHSLEHFLQGMR
jgi:hypothetical protein